MLAPLQDTGATVVTGTMFNIFAAGVMPQELVKMLLGKYEALNDAVRSVGAKHEVLFVDFARMSWTADPGLYSGDLQHANRRGHAAAAEAIVRALADHIEAA